MDDTQEIAPRTLLVFAHKVVGKRPHPVQGDLRMSINGRYTLDNVEAAHAALEERRQTGKAVVEIS